MKSVMMAIAKMGMGVARIVKKRSAVMGGLMKGLAKPAMTGIRMPKMRARIVARSPAVVTLYCGHFSRSAMMGMPRLAMDAMPYVSVRSVATDGSKRAPKSAMTET